MSILLVQKTTILLPLLTKLLTIVLLCEIFSFKDGFSGYNQINICPEDQYKIEFIYTGGTFTYNILPFGLSNVGATFPREMDYAFNDIKHNVQPYLDDLPAHSQNQTNHRTHLRAIFLCCRHYKICLNPHKCVFCVGSGHFLIFVVSKEGIQINPLKFQAILDLPMSSNLLQLQKIHGKANFLRRIIPNYA